MPVARAIAAGLHRSDGAVPHPACGGTGHTGKSHWRTSRQWHPACQSVFCSPKGCTRVAVGAAHGSWRPYDSIDPGGVVPSADRNADCPNDTPRPGFAIRFFDPFRVGVFWGRPCPVAASTFGDLPPAIVCQAFSLEHSEGAVHRARRRPEGQCENGKRAFSLEGSKAPFTMTYPVWQAFGRQRGCPPVYSRHSNLYHRARLRDELRIRESFPGESRRIPTQVPGPNTDMSLRTILRLLGGKLPNGPPNPDETANVGGQ